MVCNLSLTVLMGGIEMLLKDEEIEKLASYPWIPWQDDEYYDIHELLKAQLKRVANGIPTWFAEAVVENDKLGKLPVGSGKVILFLKALLDEVKDATE